MAALFTEVEGSAAILVKRGGYRQVALYKRAGSNRVYAKYGGDLILLSGNNTTSKLDIRWEHVECEDLSSDVSPVYGPTFK